MLDGFICTTPVDPSAYYFDEEAADRVCRFVETFCRHVKGGLAGSLIKLEPFQREFIREVFGWKEAATGLRRYKTVYLEIPRKNAKSTIIAALGLYLLTKDGEKGAEVYSCAADRSQAGLVHDIAKQMVETDPQLNQACTALKNAIVHGYCTYKALSSEAFTKHGLNASGILFDEVHAQPDDELWDVMTTSTGARDQPLTLAITTAGHDKKTLCYKLHDYAKQIRDGSISDPEFLGVIYAADPEDPWDDPATWRKANPGFGTIVKESYIAAAARKAKNMPSFLNTFKQLHLNIWTESATRWIPGSDWMASAGDPVTVEDLEGRKCWLGLDMASTRDITALAIICPNEDGTEIQVAMRYYCPEDTVEKRTKDENLDYQVWVNQGLVTATPGNVTDFDKVEQDIEELAEILDVQEILYDKWNVTQLMGHLADSGANVRPYSQGIGSMSAPSKLLERMVMEGKLQHGGDPVLAWMMANVMLKYDSSGNIKPDKQKSTEKIDGVVALVTALGGWLSSMVKGDEESSPYNQHGPRSIGGSQEDELN